MLSLSKDNQPDFVEALNTFFTLFLRMRISVMWRVISRYSARLYTDGANGIKLIDTFYVIGDN